MANTLVVDANVLLRYLLADHEDHYRQAKAILDPVRSGKMQAFVGEGVLVECVYVLLKVYQVPRDRVADELLGLLAYKGLVGHDKQCLMDALRLFRDNNVDVVDAIVVATSKRNDWEPCSFDDDIRKLAE